MLTACCSCTNIDRYLIMPAMQINVVTEPRPYSLWKTSSGGMVTRETGIVAVKAELNQLHQELANQGFNQVRTCVMGMCTYGPTAAAAALLLFQVLAFLPLASSSEARS